jgi:hypothetical protein
MPNSTDKTDHLDDIDESDRSEDDASEQVENPDEDEMIVDRPPVALMSLSRTLARRWQELEQEAAQPESDDHYLSRMPGLVGRYEPVGPDVDLELMAKLWRVMIRQIQARYRASRQAQLQLNREINALAESLGRRNWIANRRRTRRQQREQEDDPEMEARELACASTG